MKISSSHIVAVLAGVMLAGFLPHEEWVVGWSGILALIITAVEVHEMQNGCVAWIGCSDHKKGSHGSATQNKNIFD